MVSQPVENGACVILSTVDSAEEAKKVAHALVDEELAACVNQIPGATSVFKWEGKVCEEQEILLVIKTRTSLISAIESRFEKLHPYSVPELVALPIRSGGLDYLRWIAANTRP